jgi:hypothetical protein
VPEAHTFGNIHECRLHNMSDFDICNNYYNQCDIDDYNNCSQNVDDCNKHYVDDDHIAVDDSYLYEIDQIYGNIADAIDGVNPGYNVTNNLSYVKRTLDSNGTKLITMSETLSP